MPELSGRYVYGDFCGGWIRSFRYRGGMAIDDEQWIDTALKFTSFGTDSADELYVGTLSGELYRLDPAR